MGSVGLPHLRPRETWRLRPRLMAATSGESELRWMGETFTYFLATGEQTGDTFALVDEQARRGTKASLCTRTCARRRAHAVHRRATRAGVPGVRRRVHRVATGRELGSRPAGTGESMPARYSWPMDPCGVPWRVTIAGLLRRRSRAQVLGTARIFFQASERAGIPNEPSLHAGRPASR
jgi:hypothetical protein